jgi:hypothetical protein
LSGRFSPRAPVRKPAAPRRTSSCPQARRPCPAATDGAGGGRLRTTDWRRAASRLDRQNDHIGLAAPVHPGPPDTRDHTHRSESYYLDACFQPRAFCVRLTIYSVPVRRANIDPGRLPFAVQAGIAAVSGVRRAGAGRPLSASFAPQPCRPAFP